MINHLLWVLKALLSAFNTQKVISNIKLAGIKLNFCKGHFTKEA